MNDSHPQDALLQEFRSLPAEERAQLQAHVNGCPQCRKRVETYRLLCAAFAIDGIEVPAEMRQLIMARAQKAFRRRNQRQLFWRFVTYGFGAAFFAASAVYFYDPMAERQLISDRTLESWGMNAQVWSSLQTLVQRVNLDWPLFLFAVAALGVIALLDQVYRARHRFFLL